jgi:hypothetical protein
MPDESRGKMTAPPSTAYKIVDVPEPYKDVIDRHGVLAAPAAVAVCPW